MKNKNIYVIGVGPYSIVMAELAEVCGYSVKGYYHFNSSRNGEEYFGKSIISSTSELLSNKIKDKNFLLSMGDNKIRLDLAKKLRDKGANVPSIIHPTVELSPTATIKQGVILKRNVSIQSVVKIARDTIIADNTVVCHHSTIGKGCLIAGACIVGAYTKIKSKVFIGQGVIIPSGKVQKIKKSAKIGAGSVVLKNVEAYQVVVGNPAKHLKYEKK